MKSFGNVGGSSKENAMALRFDPRDVNEFLVLFWMQVDGDTCEGNEFRAFAGLEISGGAHSVVGMEILAEDEGRDSSFLSVMEFRDGGLSVHGGGARELVFMATTQLGCSAIGTKYSHVEAAKTDATWFPTEAFVLRRRWLLSAVPGQPQDDPGSSGESGSAKRCACSPSQHPGSFRCRLHHGEYVWRGRANR
ncbi:hypothetical protein V8G54_011656 [Vigna mungo]|uniref:Uncharacterized protein n=1 Tax=Vigna mungo TaxID=3915 RepID=A0AAQ3NQG5_VIGMU